MELETEPWADDVIRGHLSVQGLLGQRGDPRWVEALRPALVPSTPPTGTIRVYRILSFTCSYGTMPSTQTQRSSMDGHRDTTLEQNQAAHAAEDTQQPPDRTCSQLIHTTRMSLHHRPSHIHSHTARVVVFGSISAGCPCSLF